MVAVRYLRALFVVLLLLLTACDPPSKPVDDATIEGKWVTSGPNGRAGTIVFSDDKKFLGSDLPDRVFYGTFDDKHGGPPDWNSTDRIQGTWSTKWDGGISQAFVVINMTGRLDNATMEVIGTGAARTLRYYYTDADSMEYVEFAKVS